MNYFDVSTDHPSPVSDVTIDDMVEHLVTKKRQVKIWTHQKQHYTVYRYRQGALYTWSDNDRKWKTCTSIWIPKFSIIEYE